MRRTAFTLWVAFVFALSPCARAVQLRSRAALGNAGIFAAIGALVAAGALMLVATELRRRCSGRRTVLIAAVAAVVAFVTAKLRGDPEEAFHLVEYGVMSLLCVRTLDAVSPGRWNAVIAAASTGGIGAAEELFQWALPNRYFDFRDVGMNFLAASAVQLLRGGERLRLPPPRAAIDAAAFATAMVLCCTLLTPSRIRALVEREPALDFLADEAVIEFGFLHRLDGGINFRSRYSRSELAELDRSEGDRAAAALTAEASSWESFLSVHSSIRSPFVHEAAVHLFRRNRSLQLAEANPSDRVAASSAVAEETILRERYGRAAARQLLSPERLDRVIRMAGAREEYTSPVSESLVVALGEHTVQGAASIVLVALLIARWVVPRGER